MVCYRYCDGSDLLSKLTSVKRFNEPKAAEILRQILSALEACHKKGIVHRDLKLENILFDSSSPKGAVKIIDFGQSKILMNKEDTKEFTGSVMVTSNI